MKRWRRGTALSEAELVYEGHVDDISVSGSHDPTSGYERDLVGRSLDFYRSVLYLRRPTGDLAKIDVPDDAGCGIQRDWPLIWLRSSCPVSGVTYPAGVVLAARSARTSTAGGT